eukprot:6323326-Prymnesium_polylepis.1
MWGPPRGSHSGVSPRSASGAWNPVPEPSSHASRSRLRGDSLTQSTPRDAGGGLMLSGTASGGSQRSEVGERTSVAAKRPSNCSTRRCATTRRHAPAHAADTSEGP